MIECDLDLWRVLKRLGGRLIRLMAELQVHSVLEVARAMCMETMCIRRCL